MSVVSVDLAYQRYSDVGVVVLEGTGSGVTVQPVRLAALPLPPSVSVAPLGDFLAALAEDLGAFLIMIDGPQGWKSPDNGIEHSRVCERRLGTPGKTGLPGTTKPGNYLGFISFSIDLFDALAERGWPRLETATPGPGMFAVESFPTSAWRSLGLSPLPGKARTTLEVVTSKTAELARMFALDVREVLSHDELQATVAGLAGLGLLGNPGLGAEAVGVPPFLLEGHWREGFILNPTRPAGT